MSHTPPGTDLDAYSVEDVFNIALSELEKDDSKNAAQWVRGCGWGTFFALVARALRIPVAKWETHFGHHEHEALVHPDYEKLINAAWLFVHRGLAYPVLIPASGGHRLYSLDFTEAGVQRVRSWIPDKDGAHRAGYLQRLQKSQPKIDPEVFARLQDAEACLDAHLYRPAIVMIGIATEVTLKALFQTMSGTLGLCKGTAKQFKDILADVLAQHGGLFDGEANETRSEKIHRIKMALAFMETIRDQRNKAAHPGNDSPDGAIVRAQFTTACLHLPLIWELVIITNLPPT